MLPPLSPLGPRGSAAGETICALHEPMPGALRRAEQKGSRASLGSTTSALPKLSAAERVSVIRALPRPAVAPSVAAPRLSPCGGSYDHQVVVRVQEDEEGVHISYIVEHAGDSLAASPAIHGRPYRKPFVLDEPGEFVVRAMGVRDEWGLECSPVVTARYIVRPEPPRFTTEGGSYEGQVAVHMVHQPSATVRYIIARVGEMGADAVPSLDDEEYREPFLLSRPGAYVVRAVAFKGRHGLVGSAVASETFEVHPVGLGERLRDLPKEMISGVIRFAGGVKESFLGSKLHDLKSAIATAAKTTQSCVSLQIKTQGKGTTKRVEVDFSVEVERGAESQSMVGSLTDSSLVQHVASLVGVTAKKVVVKAEAHPLQEALLSLDWGFPQTGNDFLDGSCLIYSEHRLLDVVDYRGARNWSAGTGPAASVLHSGDVMSPGGGSHVIRVRLAQLPDHVTDCFFTLSAYNCRDLSLFRQPSMRLFDADCPSHLLTTYEVADAGHASAVVVCALTRSREAWTVRGFSRTCDATVRDYAPLEAAIAPVQEPYLRWRRRRDVILIAALWHADRALPRGLTQEMSMEDIMIPLIQLPAPLFQTVLLFL